MEWWQAVGAIAGPVLGLAGVCYAAYLGFRGKRGETTVAASTAQDAAIAARWDDASELSQYIRKEIEQEVERQVAPIRQKLERVESESHEMNVAVRARETQLWLWDQRGRPGSLPRLPDPILHRLGLGYLTDDDWSTEPPIT